MVVSLIQAKENGLEVNLLKTHQFSTISIAASFLKPIESAAEPEEETIYFYGAAAYLKEQIMTISVVLPAAVSCTQRISFLISS